MRAFRFELREPVKWQDEDAVVIGRSWGTFLYSIQLQDRFKHGVAEEELSPAEDEAA